MQGLFLAGHDGDGHRTNVTTRAGERVKKSRREMDATTTQKIKR